MKKYSKRPLGRISAATLSFLMLAASASCGKANQQQQQRGPKVEKIGKVMVIGATDPNTESFWKDVEKGVSDAASDLDYIVDFKCAENYDDVETQIKYVKEAIEKKYDVIAIAPNSRFKLNDDLQAAIDKNIKVITLNSKCDLETISGAIGSSNNIAAQIAAREAAKQLKKDIGKISGVGKVAIIGDTTANADERIGAFKTTFTNLVLNDIKNPSYAQQQAAAQQESTEKDTTDEDLLIDPSEAAQKAAAEAKKKGEDPEKAAREAAAEAAAKLEAAQAKKAASAPASNGESSKGTDPSADKSDAEILTEINNSYYIETDRCLEYLDAYNTARGLLSADGRNGIKIMYGTNTTTTLAIARAVESLDLSDEIIVIGYNSGDNSVAYINEGIIDGFILQNPYTIGYSCISYAKELVDENKIPSTVDTGVTLVSAENIDEPYIQLLLYPDRDIPFSLGEKGSNGQQGGPQGAQGGAPADSEQENASDNGGQK